MSRVIAVWCPDWPAVAAAADVDMNPGEPVAVISANRVLACNAAARAAGVRRGLRKREAQSRCANMYIAVADHGRDARMYEPVVAAVADIIPYIEVLRPGLIVLSARSGRSYFGSEEIVAERIIDVVSSVGVECQVGVADELFAAAAAARRGLIVPAGRSREFLAQLPIGELGAEPSLCVDERTSFIDLLHRLGIRTLGDFAALSLTDVTNRFGEDAIAAYRSACALPDRPPSAQKLPPDLVIRYVCDPVIDRIDAAAFVGRMLAAQLHDVLNAHACACTRLVVTACTEDGDEHVRTWRCSGPLTPESTADRIRWQLDGWLSSPHAPTSGISVLMVEPVEVVSASVLQSGLWGGVGESDERAHRALVRIQGLLGGDAVQVGVRSGGRGPGDQITFASLGDELVPQQDSSAPWPGKMLAPSPSVLMNADVQLTDGANRPVKVTGRGLFTAEPTTLEWGSKRWQLTWWAGPWLAEDSWWSGASTVARAQVLLDSSRALLIKFCDGKWVTEGVYE